MNPQKIYACKNCGKEVSEKEIARQYGKESIVLILRYCGAMCYTEANFKPARVVKCSF